MTEEKSYYSKLLLFGEYSVICDSMGLTVPLRRFSARWSFADEDEMESRGLELINFWHFLSDLQAKKLLKPNLDLERFKADLDNHLYFESNIPQGFGVGSSGALCAAVYERYAKNPVLIEGENEKRLIQLKEQLAQMESHFHGVSSGLDPLLCYLQRPLLIKNKHEIAFSDIPEDLDFVDFQMFLIDTGVTGKTGPLVNRFFDQCRQHSFYSKFTNELIPANNACIQAMEANDSQALFVHLAILSGFFLNHFGPMIPDNFKAAWQHGLHTGDFYLKLCGSGGGGFLLGFTQKPEAAAGIFASSGIEMMLL